jgi:hypothetical protein
MRGWIRFSIGFLLGLLLTGAGFFLAGIGHGTYAPLVCNTGLIGFFLPPLSLFIAPFQWGLYLVLIPALPSSRWRTFWIVAVILIHLLPGIWLATDDPAFARAMKSHQTELLIYVGLLAVPLAVLVFLGLKGTETRLRNDD